MRSTKSLPSNEITPEAAEGTAPAPTPPPLTPGPPLGELQEPLTPLVDPLPEDSVLYQALRTTFHSARVFGYAPFVIWSLLQQPQRTVGAVAAYYTLLFGTPDWTAAVRRVAALGSSTKPRLIRAQSKAYDTSKQYILAAHPHGLLNCGWMNLIARYGLKLVDGLDLVMCMAPGFKWYPLYGEIFGNQAADPSAETIRKVLRTTRMSPAILPGGFSEAVYTNADPTVEYNYIGDRMGFVRLAIEHGVDIIPTYTYGLNDMYRTLGWRRQWRASKAQAWGIPLVFWTGPLGGWVVNNPYTEDVTVCTFDPFPASTYTLEQLPQAHADYLKYLERCFDSRKAEFGAAHKRIEFVGRHGPMGPRCEGAAPRAKL
jgi:hypothetical protein